MLDFLPSARRGLSWSAGLAAAWVALALLRSGTTFHLGPLLVAVIAPIVVLPDSDLEPAGRTVLVASALAVSVAVVATLTLNAAGAMTGPSLLPFGGAVTEALILIAVGGVVGPVLAAAQMR